MKECFVPFISKFPPKCISPELLTKIWLVLWSVVIAKLLATPADEPDILIVACEFACDIFICSGFVESFITIAGVLGPSICKALALT